MENKAAFVQAINDALITFGGGRYDYLRESPLHYTKVNGHEMVWRGDKEIACVTGDSLRGMLYDIGKRSDSI